MYNYYQNPNEEPSPGNFRQPTLGKCQEYLNYWASQGVTSISHLNQFDMTPHELRLERIRFREAAHYVDRYNKQLGHHSSDSYVYRKPLFSVPAEDAEDYGDFEPISKSASRRYLRQFHNRQLERSEQGLDLEDVERYPFKPRYDEAIEMIGSEDANTIEDDVFGRGGWELVRSRRNPNFCANCNCRNCRSKY